MDQRLVLLGVGHTHAGFLRNWQRCPIPNCQLTCISVFPTATYSGMLPGVLASQISDQAWRLDLQTLCRTAGATFIVAETMGLDLQQRRLRLRDHPDVPFDVLSINIGSVPAGLPSNAGADELISIKPMQTFLDRLNRRLNSLNPRRNASPTIAVVGGGVASIEVALCLSDWLERRQHKTELTIFTDREEAAADLGWIGRKRLHKLLLGRGVKMRTCQRVLNVTDGIIETEDATRHAADVVIWMTQASPPPLIATLGLPQDKRGFVATKPTLQSTGDERIFAAGDCGTIIPMPTAKAGVYAVRQTPVLTHNIAAVLSGRPTVTFKPQKRFLKLINTGDGKAMLVYEPIAIHARWCRYLKQHIDTRFMRQFGAAVGKESSTNVIS